jgi:ATP-binding cassette subfamily B multidrug efflux pump
MSAAPGGDYGRPRAAAFGGAGRGGMGRPVEKAKNFKGTVRRLAAYLKPYGTQLIFLFVLTAVSTVLTTIAPKITGLVITKIYDGVSAKLAHKAGAAIDFSYISRRLLLLAGLFVLSAIFTYIVQLALSVIAQKTVFRLRQDIDAKFLKLPLKYYDSRTHGEIMSRITNDVDNIGNTMTQGLPQLISSAIGVIGAVIMMLVISPILTLITIFTLPLSFAVTILIAGKSQKYFADQQKELGKLNGHVEEMYSGHKIVKVFGYEKESTAAFEKINEKLYASGRMAQFISGFIFPMMNFINNLGYVAVCVAGGIFVAGKKMSIGDIQAFIQYIRMFTQPVAQSAGVVNMLQSAAASAERVFEILDETEEIQDAEDLGTISRPSGEVVFEGIKFGYREDLSIFDGLSIRVKPGQTVAIVGPTGAGKTTLVNLLMRFYEIEGGKITVDGIDIKNIKRGNLRRMFGMVLQDTWLFNGTIRENIAYGCEGATDAAIIESAKAAHADHFIRALPDGYNTLLNEEASNISQGEKQLLTIARAILADPAILILDEATSSVDTRTEVLVQKAMKVLMQGRTSFVIAHRLSTIRDAGVILVMNNGKIIEQGSHDILMAANGFYAEMYRIQFTGAFE